MTPAASDDAYVYHLPGELIANTPAEPRDSSRLFVYDTKTGTVNFDFFSNIDKYLPPKSVLVLNNTKVVPARVILRKISGGKIEALFLLNEWGDKKGPVKAMLDRKAEVDDVLYLGKTEEAAFKIVGQDGHIFSLLPHSPPQKIYNLLEEEGKTPIPKYIKSTDLNESELRKKYQSIFAVNPASVAAPTASLHFTEEVFAKLNNKEVRQVPITLHVGLGTFAPVTDENMESGELHSEPYDISYESARAIQMAKQNSYPVIAVGTTVVRALESAADKILSGSGYNSETNIFIRPPYDFKVADAFITNFHLPNSSLMMLVEAFLQSKNSPKHLVELYKMAIKEKFRFYSFGDAMLIK